MGKNQKNHQNLLEMTPNFERNEQGRSMVEMLGVLAIVGVLSVGAISGYRYAMNKYRANQTVNELNLLSHQVAIAMMSKNGVTELKLGEPYDTDHKLTSAGYNFEFGCGNGTTPDCTGKYHFNVQNVSEGVCKELVQMSEHMQFIKDHPTDCNTTNLNFVFELPEAVGNSTTTPEESEPTPTVNCPTGTDVNGAGGFATMDKDNSCYCNASGEKWNGTACVEQPSICATFKDCDKGFFCNMTQEQPTGTCAELGGYMTFEVNGVNAVQSDKKMLCDAVGDWCVANNMQPLTRERIGCGDDYDCPLGSKDFEGWAAREGDECIWMAEGSYITFDVYFNHINHSALCEVK